MSRWTLEPALPRGAHDDSSFANRDRDNPGITHYDEVERMGLFVPLGQAWPEAHWFRTSPSWPEELR